MLSPTLPAHQKQGKGSTLAAQGRQGGTDTLWTRVGFCVTMGQKLRNVPSKSLFQGIDEALSAIKSRRNCLTLPLNPHPPSPGVWLGGWVLVRKVSDGVEDAGLRLWGIK
jgi:hypothetical protein